MSVSFSKNRCRNHWSVFFTRGELQNALGQPTTRWIIQLKSKSKNWIFWVCRAIRHPASGYVQGINDLVTPFLVIFLSEYLDGGVDSWSMDDLSAEKVSDVEADCYWCLTKLLDGMQDHYTFAQPGIQRLVFKLKELVRRIDGRFLLACSC